MNTNEVETFLRSEGFVDADQVKDFGYVIKDLLYVKRVHQGQHQLVSACFYEGRFLESAFLVYDKAFNSRAKPAMHPIFSTLVRNLTDLTNVMSKVYEPPKDDKKNKKQS